ncbi:hypothetical protein KKF84_18175 [Myxococcota bacterium]|nr:hypothetical protein [Myxococcota bacterium]MBU1537250.1 hypothetical protein [Myxococcota bacterium]
MKHIVSTFGFLLLFTFSLSTFAAEGTKAVPPEKRVDNWSIGAGFLSSGYSYALAGYMGGLSSYASTPTSSMTLERRLSDNLWLTMGLSSSFSVVDDEADINAGYTITTQSFVTEVAIGFRYIFNPRGAVEISAFGGLSFVYGTQTQETDTEEWTSRSLAPGLVVGLALERCLLDNLYLRLHTTIGSVYYSTVKSEEKDSGATADMNQIRGGISLNPGIQLRLTF